MASCSSSLPNVTEVRETLSKIQKNLECPICLELLSDPFTTQCCHAFCRTCIYTVISSNKVAKCPLCKITITKRSLNENTRMGEIVEAVKELEQAIINDSGIQKTPPKVLDHTHEATGTPGMIIHSLLHPTPVKPHPAEDDSSAHVSGSGQRGSNFATQPTHSGVTNSPNDMPGPSKPRPSNTGPVVRRKRKVRFKSSRNNKRGTTESVSSSSHNERELLAALEGEPLREASRTGHSAEGEVAGGDGLAGVGAATSCDMHVIQCPSRGPEDKILNVSEMERTAGEPLSGGEAIQTHSVDNTNVTSITMTIAETPHLRVIEAKGKSPLVVKETPLVRMCVEEIEQCASKRGETGEINGETVTGDARTTETVSNLTQDTTQRIQDTIVNSIDAVLARETQFLSPPPPDSVDPLIIAPIQLAVVENTQLHTPHDSPPHSSLPFSPHSSQLHTTHSSQPTTPYSSQSSAIITPTLTNSSHQSTDALPVHTSNHSPVISCVTMATSPAPSHTRSEYEEHSNPPSTPVHSPTSSNSSLSPDYMSTPHSTLLSLEHTPTPHDTLLSAELSTQGLVTLRQKMMEKQREVEELEALLDHTSTNTAVDPSASSLASESPHEEAITSETVSSCQGSDTETPSVLTLNHSLSATGPSQDKLSLHSLSTSVLNPPPSCQASLSQGNKSPVDSPKVIFETQFTAQSLSENTGGAQSVSSQTKKRERSPCKPESDLNKKPSPKRTRNEISPMLQTDPNGCDAVNDKRLELNSDDFETCSLPSPNAHLPDDHPFMSITTIKTHNEFEKPLPTLVGVARASPPPIDIHSGDTVQSEPSTVVAMPIKCSPDSSVPPVTEVPARLATTIALQCNTPKQCGGRIVQTPALTGGFHSPGGETRRTLSLVGSGLSKSQLRQAQKFARNHGGRLASVFNCHTTHVIMSCDSDGLCPRTVKYLQGVLAGVWVLGFHWIEESLKRETLLPEESYEVKGDNTLPDSSLCVPTKARLNRASQGSGLFSSRLFYLHCDLTGISRDQISQLLRLGGGEVVECVSGDEVMVCDCDDSVNTPLSAFTVISSRWVLDSISRYQLLPMTQPTCPV